MSFSRSFTFYVSGRVHYPASEKGGSVSYHDSVDVVVDVDTDALDRSVSRCVSRTEDLTAAVESEGEGVVKEKVRATNKIAGKLVSGFFNYIRYGVKEKLMQLGARIPSLLQALRGLGSNCTGTRLQLEKDYQRIADRYSQLFEGLDADLMSSLLRLDAPVFTITDCAKSVIVDNDLSEITAHALLTGPEQASADGALIMSRVKDNTRQLVQSVARDIAYNIRLVRQIDAVLRPIGIARTVRVAMPVIMLAADSAEHNGLNADGQPGEMRSATVSVECPCASNVKEIATQTQVNPLDFRANGYAKESVDAFFKKKVSAYISSDSGNESQQRVAKEVLRMWSSVTEKEYKENLG